MIKDRHAGPSALPIEVRRSWPPWTWHAAPPRSRPRRQVPHGLSAQRTRPVQQRCFTSATDLPIHLDVSVFSSEGELLNQATVVLAPFDHHQLSNLVPAASDPTAVDAYAVVQSPTEGAQYFVYASVIDNRTGDPIYVPAIRIAGSP